MQVVITQPNNVRTGTCPHGLPLGACPICNGMSGTMKKADFSAKPGEMSWNECAAIGAFLRAQRNAKLLRKQDIQTHFMNLRNFQAAMENAHQRLADLAGAITANRPAIIAKPVNFVLNTVLGGIINTVKNIPAAISSFANNFTQKLADISDKLAAVFGELKNAVLKKISDTFREFKKKVKSLFAIFQPLDTDNDEKKINETKKAFKLKTFFHKLYKKFKKEQENSPKKD